MMQSSGKSNWYFVLKKLTRFLIAAGLLVLAYLLRVPLATALTPVIIAVVIAYLLHPLNRVLRRKCKMKAWLAITLSYLALLLLIALIFVFLVPMVITGIQHLIDSLPDIMNSLGDKFDRIQEQLSAAGIVNSLGDSFRNFVDSVPQALTGLLQNAFGLMSNTISILTTVLISLYISVFISKDYRLFSEDMYRLLPRRYRRGTRETVLRISRALLGFLKGQFLIALVSLIGTTVGYYIIQLEYALPLGILMGVFSLVPYIGPFLGAIPALLIGLLFPDKLLWTLIVIVIVQGGIGIFSPKIMSDKLDIHPVYIMVGILFFASLLGIIGMLFALPIMIIIREIAAQIKMERRREIETKPV
jgi:predicted PurR-regulated permease PerM